MKYYQTDLNGFLTGEGEADESPLEPGVFLIPGGAVTTQPPTVGANQAAQFTGDVWRVVDDLRGTKYWAADRQEHEITERGVSLPPGATLVRPPPTLDELKAAKLAELKAAWDATQNIGIQTRGHTFLTGGKARERLDRLLAAQANGITIPDTIRADDGTPVDFTAVTIKALYDAVIKAERLAEDNYWTKRAQVVAATTPEQVAAVVW